MSFFKTVANADAALERLRTLLSHLPDSIPLGNSKYNFERFAPDPEKVELYGTSEAAINHELEVTFAPKGRKDESVPYPFQFEVRGPGCQSCIECTA